MSTHVDISSMLTMDTPELKAYERACAKEAAAEYNYARQEWLLARMGLAQAIGRERLAARKANVQT